MTFFSQENLPEAVIPNKIFRKYFQLRDFEKFGKSSAGSNGSFHFGAIIGPRKLMCLPRSSAKNHPRDEKNNLGDEGEVVEERDLSKTWCNTFSVYLNF